MSVKRNLLGLVWAKASPFTAEIGVGGTIASLTLQNINHVVSIIAGVGTVLFVVPSALLKWRTAWYAWKHDHASHSQPPPAP